MKKSVIVIICIILLCTSIVTASFANFITGSAVIEPKETSIFSILKSKLTGFLVLRTRSVCGDGQCDFKEGIRYKYYQTCPEDCAPIITPNQVIPDLCLDSDECSSTKT
ncbi:MAG: hypothetical protein ABIF40_05545 [archaeon]